MVNSSGYPEAGVAVTTDRMNEKVYTDKAGEVRLTLDGYTYLYVNGSEKWRGYEYEFGGEKGHMVVEK